jgi:5-(carboxyamino)imidazole ribonucleotide synthase
MKNKIGIVGGGQLARMMIFPAKQLGFFVSVLDPTPNSPAGQIADQQIVADLNDEQAMMQLAKGSDFLTLDWELANPDILEKIEKKSISINPSPQALRIVKDKYQQKVFLKKNGIPVADFMEVTNISDIKNGGEKFRYPLLLKAKLGAYDGKGNYLIKTKNDIVKGLKKLKGRELYLEKFVPFQKELAIMVTRSIGGEIITYPLVETIHKNNILHMTLAPAPVEEKIMVKATSLARKTTQHLKGAGVFGIEMFLTKEGEVLINEIAPRVHNSGHYTIEACTTSQFAQHIRAISGLPLGKTTMTVKAAVMINILGERTGKAEIQGLENVLSLENTFVHMYGKADTKPERKMGHITVTGDSLSMCLQIAKKARKYLSI